VEREQEHHKEVKKVCFFSYFRKKRFTRRHRGNEVEPSPKTTGTRYYKPSEKKISDEVDLRNMMSEVRDQRNINSCFAFAGAGILEALMKKKTGFKHVVSPAFNYYWTRKIEGTYPGNVGAYMSNYMKSLKENGFVLEKSMPFLNRADQEPSIALNALGLMTKFYLKYTKKVSVKPEDYLDCLNKEQPLFVGMRINTEWFDVRSDGIIDSKTPNIGGHAIIIAGRILFDADYYAIIKNSWGRSYGDKGYCYVPWEYVEKYSFEAYTIDYNNLKDNPM